MDFTHVVRDIDLCREMNIDESTIVVSFNTWTLKAITWYHAITLQAICFVFGE